VLARDGDGFILTGADVGAEGLLETSVAGVYAAGDVRAGSTKRCATAVGEGAAVVGFVHERLAREIAGPGVRESQAASP
jgi:thioredoxin reductase (NADPH)